MFRTVRLASLIEKSHIKYRDFNSDRELKTFGVSNTEGITRTTHRRSDDLDDYLVIQPGSIAYNPYRVNVGSIGLTPDGVYGLVSPAYVVFRAKKRELVPEVLLDFLKSSEGLRQINNLARGTVRKALRFDDLCKIDFPIIPYDQQLKILERKQNFNQQHRRLLSEITHQETLLEKLKLAILHDAIQGKLTAAWRKENPESEPASQLLERFRKEKQRVIAEKKLRKEKPLLEIVQDETPFEIPKGWIWCRMGILIKEKPRNGISLKPVGYQTGTKTLKLSATSSGNFDGSQCKYLDCSIEPDSHLWLRDGDILIQRANSLELVGTAAIYRGRDFEFVYPDLMMKCQTMFPESTNYLLCVLSSRFARDYFKNKASGSAGNFPKISQHTVMNVLIPFPSLAEQVAIVERVDAMMATCKALEAEIKHSYSHAENILQAALKEAFTAA